jgi:hypothetical protein
MFFARLAIDPFAEQGDAAARDRDQSDEQSPDGRFPRTGFANQAQCLTVTDFEADAIDRTKQQFLASIAPYRKDLDEVLD